MYEVQYIRSGLIICIYCVIYVCVCVCACVNAYTDNTDIQDQNVKSPCKALAGNRKIDKQATYQSLEILQVRNSTL